MNRREFADTAAKTFLGVTAAPLIASGERLPTAKNVIYLYMNGGMTHLDTFDPNIVMLKTFQILVQLFVYEYQ